MSIYQQITDICFENGGVNKPMVDKLDALVKVEVAKARHEGFVGAKVACTFATTCNHCHANKLSLDFLVEPETAEVESNGDTSTTTATMSLPEIPLKGYSK